MDKLDLHESLRIYLPGLYAMMIINFFFHFQMESSMLAILAIFAGLVIHSLSIDVKLISKYIETFHSGSRWPKIWRHDMFRQRQQVFLNKFQLKYDESSPIVQYLLNECITESKVAEKNILSLALRAFDAGRYDIPQNKQMRLLSTFGHLKASLSVISLFTCLGTAIWHQGHWWAFFLLLAIIFFHGAIKAKKLSLLFENRLYKNYDDDELKKLGELICREKEEMEQRRPGGR